MDTHRLYLCARKDQRTARNSGRTGLEHHCRREVALDLSGPANGTLKQSMNFTINGHNRTLELPSGVTLDKLIAALELKGDRIAVEHNGEIVQRTQWPATPVSEGDRFEIVHFVGGGSCADGESRPPRAISSNLSF
jgi:thiamine biosynthesis protein ThiS